MRWLFPSPDPRQGFACLGGCSSGGLCPSVRNSSLASLLSARSNFPPLPSLGTRGCGSGTSPVWEQGRTRKFTCEVKCRLTTAVGRVLWWCWRAESSRAGQPWLGGLGEPFLGWCWGFGGQKGQVSLHRAVLEAPEMLKVGSLGRSSRSPGCFGVTAQQLGSAARGTGAAAPLHQYWGYWGWVASSWGCSALQRLVCLP